MHTGEKKEDRRVAMTKRMLKDSLLELLKTVHIHDISIRELCEHADVNRSTFYKYYGSQYELLKHMEDDWLQSVEDSLRHVVNVEEAPLTSLLAFGESSIELARLLVNSNVDPDFPQRLFALPSIKRLIDEALPVSEQQNVAEYRHHFYAEGCYQVVRFWLNKQERESPEEMAKIILQVLHIFPGAGG